MGARLSAAANPADAHAQLRIVERLGVPRPQVTLVPGQVRPVALVGAGGGALALAARHYRVALMCAADTAATQETHRRVAAELRRTTRRLRAIEWRFVPRHQQALAALDLALDETEREDAARTRWAAHARARRR